MIQKHLLKEEIISGSSIGVHALLMELIIDLALMNIPVMILIARFGILLLIRAKRLD
jgi:hypothetical protein